MIRLALPLTIGLSLSHPKIFGSAWYLLIIICIGIGTLEWTNRLKTGLTYPNEPRTQLSNWPAWKIWLLAFGPLTIISVISTLTHDLSLGRAEVIEIFLGGLIFAIALNSENLKIKLTALTVGAALAGYFALLVTVYESALLNITRVGENFNPINYGIACGSSLLILILLITLLDETSLTVTSSKSLLKRWNGSWILSGAALGSGLALLYSGSRGPILAFVFSIMAALTSGNIRHKLASLTAMQKLSLAMISITFLVGVMLAIYPRLIDSLHAGAQSSDGVRWRLILIAIAQIEKSPWFGIGADQAGRFYTAFFPPISDFNHVHVTLLNIALELGLPGALSWIWAFGVLALVFSPWKFSVQSSTGILGFLVCAYLFACSMTQDVMSHSYTRKYLALIIPLLLSIHQTHWQKHVSGNH